MKPGAARRVGRGGARGEAFALPVAQGGEGTPAPVSGALPIGAVAALLAVQDVADPGPGGAGRRRAEDLLAGLDEIRDGLLRGALSRARLEELVRRVEERGTAEPDPRLAALLGEIELRARVELAKLDMI